jgi:hypothetical protein
MIVVRVKLPSIRHYQKFSDKFLCSIVSVCHVLFSIPVMECCFGDITFLIGSSNIG